MQYHPSSDKKKDVRLMIENLPKEASAGNVENSGCKALIDSLDERAAKPTITKTV